MLENLLIDKQPDSLVAWQLGVLSGEHKSEYMQAICRSLGGWINWLEAGKPEKGTRS